MLASQPVSSSPVKAAVAVPQPESNAADDEEDDGEFSEPMQKTAAAAKSKTVEQECQKRSAPDPGPFSKRNKAKVVCWGIRSAEFVHLSSDGRSKVMVLQYSWDVPCSCIVASTVAIYGPSLGDCSYATIAINLIPQFLIG
jgi:hypothetical protein